MVKIQPADEKDQFWLHALREGPPPEVVDTTKDKDKKKDAA